MILKIGTVSASVDVHQKELEGVLWAQSSVCKWRRACPEDEVIGQSGYRQSEDVVD